MEKDFFVILNTPDRGYTHMTTGDDGDMAEFGTYEEAVSSAENSSLGDAFGFEVFQRGDGV